MRGTLASIGLLCLTSTLPAARAQPDGGLPPPRVSAGKVDLAAEVERVIALVNDRARFRADTAAALMLQGHADLAGLDPARVDHVAVGRDAARLERRLFDLILALDERMAGFAQAGALTDEVAMAKRRALRGIRYLREQVLLRAREADPAAFAAAPAPAFARDLPARHRWIARPDWAGRRLDQFPDTFVVLCVGSSVVSAAIARVSAEDTMFSHLALAHRRRQAETIEGKTYPAGTWFIVEALIEKGVTVHPLADHYQGTTRDVTFVVRDASKQAAIDAAAGAFFARARDAIAAGRPLGYDFTMGGGAASSGPGLVDVIEGRSRSATESDAASAMAADTLQDFFCSGVADAVFSKAGVPLFTNRSYLRRGPATRGLFEAWGIDPDKQVPAPGDADISGSLLRVAEGTYLDGVTSSLVGHSVLAEMFSWMDDEGWRLRSPWYARLGASVVGTFNGGWFDLGLVPDTMGEDVMATFAPLAKAGDKLIERMTAEEAAFRARHGRPMTPVELRRRTREVRGDVSGVSDWFAPAPRVLGRYALETTTTAYGRRRVELTVTPHHGLDLRVHRRELDPHGRVRYESRGLGRQRGAKLHVTFSERSEPALPITVTYTIRDDGRIEGGTPDNARVEAGRRAD